MNVDLAVEIWEMLRPHINSGYASAAEDFIQVLVEHGIDPEDIKAATSDSYLNKALLDYVEEEYHEEEDDFYYDDEDE